MTEQNKQQLCAWRLFGSIEAQTAAMCRYFQAVAGGGAVGHPDAGGGGAGNTDALVTPEDLCTILAGEAFINVIDWGVGCQHAVRWGNAAQGPCSAGSGGPCAPSRQPSASSSSPARGALPRAALHRLRRASTNGGVHKFPSDSPTHAPLVKISAWRKGCMRQHPELYFTRDNKIYHTARLVSTSIMSARKSMGCTDVYSPPLMPLPRASRAPPPPPATATSSNAGPCTVYTHALVPGTLSRAARR